MWSAPSESWVAAACGVELFGGVLGAAALSRARPPHFSSASLNHAPLRKPPQPRSDTLLNMQNDQPLLSDYDKECLITLGQVRALASHI